MVQYFLENENKIIMRTRVPLSSFKNYCCVKNKAPACNHKVKVVSSPELHKESI